MSRKDYIAIAMGLNQLFRDIDDMEDTAPSRTDEDAGWERGYIGALEDVVSTLSLVFTKDNPRFDSDQFSRVVLSR